MTYQDISSLVVVGGSMAFVLVLAVAIIIFFAIAGERFEPYVPPLDEYAHAREVSQLHSGYTPVQHYKDWNQINSSPEQ